MIGTPPHVSVTLRGLVFTFGDATNRFVAGPKWLQMDYVAVRALVADDVSQDWIIRAAQVGADRFGITGTGVVAEQATGGELFPPYAAFHESLGFLGLAAGPGADAALSAERMQVLRLGAAAEWLIAAVAADADLAAAVLSGRPLPAWFDADLQLAEMQRHGALLRPFGAAKQAADTHPDDPVARIELERTAAALYAEVRRPADILERIRTDRALAGDHGYQLVWHTSAGNPKGATPPIAAADAAPDPMFTAGLLGFLWTQQNLWPDLLASSAEGTAARKRVLHTFAGWVAQVAVGEPGDVELTDAPATANMAPLPATLTATPTIGPPLFDASVKTDYHFTMALQFPDVFEAFSTYRFVWSRKKVTDAELRLAAKFDPFKGGTRPTWGEVGAQRFRTAHQYAREDIKTFIDSVSSSSMFGSPGAEVGLIEAGILLRYLATGIRFALERLLTPRNEQAVSFAGADLGPGLYVVACSATPVKRGENLVRAPAVAWVPVFVRSPEDMAQIRLDAVVKGEEDAATRLAELRRKLAAPVSWLDQDAMVAEAAQLVRATGTVDQTYGLQIEQLGDRLTQLQGSTDPESVKERSAIKARIDELETDPRDPQDAGGRARPRSGRAGAGRVRHRRRAGPHPRPGGVPHIGRRERPGDLVCLRPDHQGLRGGARQRREQGRGDQGCRGRHAAEAEPVRAGQPVAGRREAAVQRADRR